MEDQGIFNYNLISIIVPTFLEENTLENCLKSIRRQGFEKGKIEIIVVDSNSTDGTKDIAGKYADQVINLRDRGVSKARNLGAKHAKGEILLFIDADTLLTPGFLAEIWESFLSSNVVCVSGTVNGLENLGLKSNILKIFHYNLLNKISELTVHLGFPFFPTVCCACRKTIFLKTGGFDEDLALAEDIVFSLKVGKLGKCIVNRNAIAYTSLRRIVHNGWLKNYYQYFSGYFRLFIFDRKPWIQDFPHIVAK